MLFYLNLILCNEQEKIGVCEILEESLCEANSTRYELDSDVDWKYYDLDDCSQVIFFGYQIIKLI